MSEYWKSVPRKFCDFCKCWITDNKPSVEFHERGKRHQENVELRLKEVRKKSLQNSMTEDQMKKDMEKMEKAALEAFKKDLKENPELAAKYGISLEPKPHSSSKTFEEEKNNEKGQKEVTVKEWFEAVSPEGHHYYWNTATGESIWEPPDDYLSLAEQEALKTSSKEESSDLHDTIKDRHDTIKDSEPVPESKEDITLTTRVDPSHSRSAYGSWSVVKEAEQPHVYDETSAPPSLDDIPLPQHATDEANTAPKKPRFKEKTVSSLASNTGEVVAFKKRKIAAGARNVRHKIGDE
ncbi:unnamed protein product [Lymnaea stagnalis]|uniref:WW domain-binding protein 4 n=1 Tax=Lymnaea stagnalis TaxID=6523 RepID=A0AAV2I779_LYMST